MWPQVNAGAEAAAIFCLLKGRPHLMHRPQPSKMHLGIPRWGAHLCPCYRIWGYGAGGPFALQGEGTSSAEFCLLHRALLSFLLMLSWAQHESPPEGSVPRLSNNRLPIFPCLLPLQHCPLLPTSSCPSPRGQCRPLWAWGTSPGPGLSTLPRRKRNWLQSPAETELRVTHITLWL